MSTFETDIAERFGPGATAEAAYDLLTVDVPAASWLDALRVARDELGCSYFDWLSAVDEPGTGFRVCAHVVALEQGAEGTSVRRLMLRTTVPHDAPVLPTAVEVFAGAGWHERETHEMFGVDFTGHPHLVPLLLPDTFEGHPLRKDFVLAARVAKAWPGAKEPGESEHGGPKRRQMLPPGVPDPNEWGPLKGQLPPAPARPARAPRAAGERPPRRTRSVSEGSASQATASAEAAPAAGAGAAARAPASGDGPGASGAPVRRSRTAAEGSASQAPARRSRSASEGSASQRPEADGAAPAPRRSRSAADRSASQSGEASPQPAQAPRGRSADAPWHHARPAFDEPEPTRTDPEARPGPGEAEAPTAPAVEPRSSGEPTTGPRSATEPAAEAVSGPGSRPEAEAEAPESGPGVDTGGAGATEPGSEPEPSPGAGGTTSEPEPEPEPGTPGAGGTTPPTTPAPRPDGGPDEGPGPRTDDATGGDRA
ncbi:NADH-quinone oxidoreductase subunit C [Streptomyces sp. WMMC940]|uniref:NADH-quinone oxidoreductase subunit C n=1 Tax=Streptomyces sp. WMMC940 TaxID=3015153 RepID=UPI0022B74A56|nr:NADH-quinone oxidoreductase subunit C [Streptomyces sp. WMMC940]MCZ7458644.1 NADH-quinone oxidoreductase subunit C [Streptomyces sp. WMMC940]